MQYVFADCRWSLDDPGWGRAQYVAGHIPGAVFLDVERDLAGPPGSGGRHPLPAADDFARAAGAAGIGEDVFVVAYGSLGGAERLWWLLRHFGHDACGVIDFASWRGPLSSGEESLEPAAFLPRPRTGDTVEHEELATGLGELVVVDARLPLRFRGEPNPIDEVPGRIPGAVNAPWSADALPELPAGELVAYCGSGITACVVLHRLHLNGREGRLYPGSWSEWEQHPELPLDTG
jgi:thiosulfate/3-mercaptopyruvate sulfurtransferase